MILRSFCKLRGSIFQDFQGVKKRLELPSRVIMSRNESMRSFLSFWWYCEETWERKSPALSQIIRRDTGSKRTLKCVLYKPIKCEMRNARCEMRPALNVPIRAVCQLEATTTNERSSQCTQAWLGTLFFSFALFPFRFSFVMFISTSLILSLQFPGLNRCA